MPALDPAVEVVADEREGRGPVQGIAAGLAAIGSRAEVAYVSATDVPLLHPAFIRRVVSAVDGFDVALPDVGGYRQPLSAAYRVALVGALRELLAGDGTSHGSLFERSRVRHMSADDLLEDPTLARLDPALLSVSNLNEPVEYERAHALPAPDIVVEVGSRRQRVGAWSLGRAAVAAGVTLDKHVVAALNGDQIVCDPELPLVPGDMLAFMVVG